MNCDINLEVMNEINTNNFPPNLIRRFKSESFKLIFNILMDILMDPNYMSIMMSIIDM
jgi:hypothetical protein